MPILDAALAFALTMLVFASAVTQIVNWVKRSMTLSSVMLKQMLDDFFQNELEPVVKRELNRNTKILKDDVSAKLTTTANALTRSDIFSDKELETLTNVATDELVERLKRSKLGEETLSALGDEANKVFGELAQRFEAVGRRFSESFREHSRRWSIVVSFVLALVVNVDSVQLINGYLKSGTVTATAIANMGSIAARYDMRVTSLVGGAANAVTTTTNAPPQTAESAESAEDSAKASSSNDSDSLEAHANALLAAVEESRDTLKSLESQGLPFGWSYFPYNKFGEEATTSEGGQAKDGTENSEWYQWFMWGVGILLTTYLGVLGAPFWYDAVSRVTAVTQKVSSRSSSMTRESGDSSSTTNSSADN